MARDTRITMIAMTIISSTMVKPNSRRLNPRPLPVGVIGSIRRLVRALGINIEDVLPAPTVGGRVILGAAHAPVDGVGEGVLGDASQKSNFLVHLALQLDALHQGLQLVRVVIGIQILLAEIAGIGVVFVLVDEIGRASCSSTG